MEFTRSIRIGAGNKIEVLDQRKLPHDTIYIELKNCYDAVYAIKEMVVRGAPLIGTTAAFGVYLAVKENDDLEFVNKCIADLAGSRPTAVNLFWALDRMITTISNSSNVLEDSWKEAVSIMHEDAEICKQIGFHGLPIIEAIAEKKKGEVVNILTHCNAGALACVDWGTATSPIYQAHQKRIKVHVWVDETRPRNQGANITAFELQSRNIPHTLITDNAGGHLMQHGKVDLVIVGTDRTTRRGDVANKVGTYLKALAAKHNKIPFYVALPSSTLDLEISNGLKEIEIETRHQDEVRYVYGKDKNGNNNSVLICPEETQAYNIGFDVTPAELVTGLITEKGICMANEEAILIFFKN